MEPTTPAPAAAEEKKSVFDTVVLSTPVLLTVIATFVLGRSSSEMTQAQYHRATAGQHQSKVGDQWAFFQAKRIRGTNYETTAVSLLATQNVEPFTPQTLSESAQSLVSELNSGLKELNAKDDKLREKLQVLEKIAETSLEQVLAALAPPMDGWRGKKLLLKADDVKAAFDALERYPDDEFVIARDDGMPEEQRQLLDQILDDIRKFKPEKEIAAKSLKLNPESLETALDQAREKAAMVSARGKRIDRILEEFDALVDRQVGLARDYQRLIAGQISALAKANGDIKEIAKLQDRLNRVRTQSAKLLGDYKAARFAFDAQRYEQDAVSNRDAAFLYDVQVLQSSARSDRHLKRSFGFMIAMLIAQVGVTIASLAMAMKRKIPVWALAALSGVVAILFGVYVFLELGPF